MGPLRRGLIAATAFAPTPIWAQDCTAAPVTALDEAIALFSSPPALVLLVATAFAVRFRHQWGALVVVLGWTALVSYVSVLRPDAELHAAAVRDGCAGSAALFIAAVTAICIAMILYTAPRPKRTD